MIVFLACVLTLVFIILQLLKADYWKKRNIPREKPWPIFGNMASVALQQKSFSQIIEDSYNKFPSERYYGFYQFTKPALMIRDPNLIKDILIRDFDNFKNRFNVLPKSTDSFFNKNLFSMKGKAWHDMRCVLSPLFTGSKMRSMFLLMTKCAQNYVDYFKSISPNGKAELDIKDVFLMYTNDIIASSAFGVELNTVQNVDNDFYRLGKNAFLIEGIRNLKIFGRSLSSRLMKILRVQFFDQDFQIFFRKLVDVTIDHREKTGFVRPDMIHFLHKAQVGQSIVDDEEVPDAGYAVAVETNKISKTKSKTSITNEDIAAQASIFFFGGFDTVGIVLAHLAYELAVNPDVQEKLIQEIDEALKEYGGNITYEALVKMKYLDMVLTETLRLWTPGIIVNRKCSNPYTIHPKNPGEKILTLDTGTMVIIPIRAIHRDPKYYPNPTKFDPERFSPENKDKIVSGTYLPFGTGPRNCIASRFGIIECKIMIFWLLSEFKLLPVKKTSIPFVLSKTRVQIGSANGYWLGLEKRHILLHK